MIGYWGMVFAGVFPVTELVPGYTTWFMSFSIADTFLGISAFLAFWYVPSDEKRGGFFGAIAGSSLLFLGLYALLYGVNTGLLFILTLDEIFEIAIKAYCLIGGAFFLYYSWKLIHQR